MPPYKLQMSFTWNYPKKYAKLLINELVRGISTSFQLHIVNRDDQTFPGGKINFLRISYSDHVTTIFPDDVIVDSLQKDQEKILPFDFIPNGNGWAWAEVKIDAVDKQPIHYFQSKNIAEKPLTDNWQSGLMILNREQLDTLLLLREISTKINKKEHEVKKVRSKK